MSKFFNIRIEGDATFETAQIWPEGYDSPENPTAAAAAEVIAQEGSLGWWLKEWSMEDAVRVYVDGVEVKF